MDEATRARSGLSVATTLPATVEAATAEGAASALERYKVSLRCYSPVQKGLAGLPWEGDWLCGRCGETTPGRILREPDADEVALEHDCARCGTWREPHADVLFTTPRAKAHLRQPHWTLSGMPIRPMPRALPRTVETLCPECSCLVLGRSYERDGAVWMEKTCPEHGYFRDKVTSDAKLWLLCEERCFQDQPLAFTGRIARRELEAKRYTLGDLAAAIARETGANVHEDFGFVRALRAMTDKGHGRGERVRKAYRTIMTTINSGPVYRPHIEALHARPLA